MVSKHTRGGRGIHMTALNRGSDPAARAEAEPAPHAGSGSSRSRRKLRLRPRLRPPSTPLMAAVAVATILACVIFFWTWRSGLATGAAQPTWFAGYVDVTVSPPYAFEEASDAGHQGCGAGFPCRVPQDSCVASWGAAYGLEEAGTALGLDKRISVLRSRGGSASVSFGGSREPRTGHRVPGRGKAPHCLPGRC